MLVFALIGAVGLFLLVVSALLGGDHDHSFDHAYEIEHDAGPSPFSLRIIALFLTGFGATGAICRAYQLSYPLSSGLGVVTGLIVGSAGYKIISLFMHQQASSTVSEDDMVGLTGEVTVAIPANGLGQVVLVVKGQRVFPSARTEAAASIEEGARIKVIRGSGSQVIVERA